MYYVEFWLTEIYCVYFGSVHQPRSRVFLFQLHKEITMKLIRLCVCLCVCVCVCVWCLRVHVCQREFKRAIFYENELMPFFLGIKWFQGLSLELQRQTLMSPNQLCKVTRPNQEFRAQLLCSIWPSLKHNIRCSLISIMPISPTQ
jgi:hypothetical protein